MLARKEKGAHASAYAAASASDLGGGGLPTRAAGLAVPMRGGGEVLRRSCRWSATRDTTGLIAPCSPYTVLRARGSRERSLNSSGGTSGLLLRRCCVWLKSRRAPGGSKSLARRRPDGGSYTIVLDEARLAVGSVRLASVSRKLHACRFGSEDEWPCGARLIKIVQARRRGGVPCAAPSETGCDRGGACAADGARSRVAAESF